MIRGKFLFSTFSILISIAFVYLYVYYYDHLYYFLLFMMIGNANAVLLIIHKFSCERNKTVCSCTFFFFDKIIINISTF